MIFEPHLHNIFYAVETWYGALRQSDFYKIEVSCHRSVNETVGLKKSNSKHVGCQIAGIGIY